MEQGSHAHLLEHQPDGAYATLLKLQLQAQEADKADALDINGDDIVPPDALQQLQACPCRILLACALTGRLWGGPCHQLR